MKKSQKKVLKRFQKFLNGELKLDDKNKDITKNMKNIPQMMNL
jgi:hypothetical protein